MEIFISVTQIIIGFNVSHDILHLNHHCVQQESVYCYVPFSYKFKRNSSVIAIIQHAITSLPPSTHLNNY